MLRKTSAGILASLTWWCMSLAGHAATVTHIYELNGSFADALGGPSMVPTGGTLGLTGYTFGAGQGPHVSQAINPATYSIEMLFSIDTTSDYRKLIDFKDRTVDTGLYNLNTALNFYDLTTGPTGTFTAGQMAHLVVTRDDTTDAFIGYVNGVQQIAFTDAGALATFTGANNIIHFLRDDSAVGGENASGFLDLVRLYDGVLTSAEVTDLFNGGVPPGLPGPSAVPEPATVFLVSLGLLGVGVVARRRQP